MGLSGDSKDELVKPLSELVKQISELPECRNVFKKIHGNLIRRIKLLSPLFEELRDGDEELDQEDVQGFELLRIALNSAMELLQSENAGSKLHQVLNSASFLVSWLNMIFLLIFLPLDSIDRR